MTADKNFKRLVRRRSRQIGLSYAATRQLLRKNRRKHDMSTHDDDKTADLSHEAAQDLMYKVITDQLRPIAEEAGKSVTLTAGLVHGSKQGGRWFVDINTPRPGLVIGPRGATAEAIRRALSDTFGDPTLSLDVVPLDAAPYVARHREHRRRASQH